MNKVIKNILTGLGVAYALNFGFHTLNLQNNLYPQLEQAQYELGVTENSLRQNRNRGESLDFTEEIKDVDDDWRVYRPAWVVTTTEPLDYSRWRANKDRLTDKKWENIRAIGDLESQIQDSKNKAFTVF